MFRFGSSPTGIRATSLRVAISTADTEFAPPVDTYTVLLSGENVIQSGLLPTGTSPSSFTSGREYAYTLWLVRLVTHNVFPSGATPMPCDGDPLKGPGSRCASGIS